MRINDALIAAYGFSFVSDLFVHQSVFKIYIGTIIADIVHASKFQMLSMPFV
ncbi:Uncharacterised protein [Candidatus Bartonella washoeensis]|uniref:Uncharacterized protein n=2 Tax=Candidatus Bartonella washoeensis TaxID=186739 RepID=J0QN29_9HYPH|nr:hypothetical protein [Bartonella washoeensis]EJF79883.1 hypothetical protein MCQ_00615 [Bartonella washoeensis Sb944nv]EJF84389.1 hypothetical protein MCW_01202 [Bartonella washoeensis 085-0475]SPU26865.1 Uncharacterised protein [Bartonella washoeensis]